MACAGVGFRSVCAGGARPYVNGVHPVDHGGVGTGGRGAGREAKIEGGTLHKYGWGLYVEKGNHHNSVVKVQCVVTTAIDWMVKKASNFALTYTLGL